MPEWLIERGIGETRAALVQNGEIVETMIDLDDVPWPGSIGPARLVSVGVNGRNAVAADSAGNEYLLPRGAAGITEGAEIMIEITRSAIPGDEPWKRPFARLAQEASDDPLPIVRRLDGRNLNLPAGKDEFGEAGWYDLLEEARSGVVRFAGGELRISPTTAMTVIDVDGYLPVEKLAVVGAREAARAIRRLDIGGSIGIDLPTAGSKAARQEAAAAIDAVLPQPFERTAVNGFGFVQIVRPRHRASLVELAQDRAGFEARALLRRIAFGPPGPRRIVGHPALVKLLQERMDWTDDLARQVGGKVELRPDPALPMSGGYAESV